MVALRTRFTLLTIQFVPDIQTLSRMTGKDFSGPTPVIRTPTPVQPPEEGLSVSEPQINGTSKRPRARKHSQTPALDGEEILGNISDIEKEDE